MIVAEHKKNYDRVTEIKTQEIPDLEKAITKTEDRVLKEDKCQGESLTRIIEPRTVAAIVCGEVHIPIPKLLQTERDRLLTLREHLQKEIIGQDESINMVVEALSKNGSESRQANQPSGLFLFLGPTDFDQMKFVKILAFELFDSTSSIIRFDMGKYHESDSVTELVGSPSNYVDLQQDGQLMEAVRQRPYAIIVFDEAEKAHPQLWDTLSQIFDANYLTNGRGEIVDLKNAIFLFTSRIGAQMMSSETQEMSTTVDGKLSQTTKDLVTLHFPRKFLYRLNEIVLFQPQRG